MPRNMRRSKVLRTITNDATIDKALREIYDKLDDLQPDKLEKSSPLYNKNAPIGSTMLLKNSIGEDSLAIKTDSGWKVDINSNLVSTNDNFNINKGSKALKGEALLYDASSNLTALNNLTIKNIPQVTSDTDKFLVSDGGTIKYVTGDTLRTYISGLRFDGSTANGVLTYKDADEINVASSLKWDDSGKSLKLYYDSTNYFGMAVGASGATTMTTIDDGVATAGSLHLDIDGTITLESAADLIKILGGSDKVFYSIDATSPVVTHKWQAAANQSDYLQMTVGANAETTFSTVDADTSVGHLILHADGDVKLKTKNDGTVYFMNGANTTFEYAHSDGNFSTFKMYERGGETNDDYFQLSVSEHGLTEISTEDDSGSNSADIVINAGGDIKLQAATGSFKLYKGGTAMGTLMNPVVAAMIFK